MTAPLPASPSQPSALRSLVTPSSRRTLLASAGLGALSLAVLAACGRAASAGSGSRAPGAGGSVADGTYGKLALKLSWIKNIEFAGGFFAASKDYYTAAGFESVDLVTGPADSADALVLTGTADVGLSTPDTTARYIVEQGAPLNIIGSTFQKNPFCILSLEEGTPIRTVADLAGRTIGIQAGTKQSMFEGSLKANNVDRSTFRTTVVQYEPTPLTAEMSCVTGETLEQDRDKLKAFVSARDRGLERCHRRCCPGEPSSPSGSTARSSNWTSPGRKRGSRPEQARRHQRHETQRHLHPDRGVRRPVHRRHRGGGSSGERWGALRPARADLCGASRPGPHVI